MIVALPLTTMVFVLISHTAFSGMVYSKSANVPAVKGPDSGMVEPYVLCSASRISWYPVPSFQISVGTFKMMVAGAVGSTSLYRTLYVSV